MVRFLRPLGIALLLSLAIMPARAADGLTLTPEPVAFGRVPVGQAEVRTVRVVNGTGSPVTIASSSAVGLQVLSTTCAAGLVLTPGAECGVVVQWQPTAAGRLVGSVTVASDAGDRIVLGTGMAVAPLRLKVASHSKTLRIRHKAQLIKKISSNGRVTRAAVWCSYKGKRLPASFAKRVCGLRVQGAHKNLTAQARPLCTEDLALRAQVVARNGVDREIWKRTWRVFVRPHAGGHPNVPICATMGERFG